MLFLGEGGLWSALGRGRPCDQLPGEAPGAGSPMSLQGAQRLTRGVTARVLCDSLGRGLQGTCTCLPSALVPHASPRCWFCSAPSRCNKSQLTQMPRCWVLSPPASLQSWVGLGTPDTAVLGRFISEHHPSEMVLWPGGQMEEGALTTLVRRCKCRTRQVSDDLSLHRCRQGPGSYEPCDFCPSEIRSQAEETLTEVTTVLVTEALTADTYGSGAYAVPGTLLPLPR